MCFPSLVTAKEKLAVMELKAKGDVKETVAEALSIEVRNTIHNQGEYEVLSKEDLAAIADRTRMRQSLGCDDTQCLIDFGQAIGTKYMIAGSVSKLGKTYSIDLRLIDTEGEDAGVKSRGSKKCKCAEDELSGTAQAVAGLLMGKKKPEVRGPVETAQARVKMATGRLFVETNPKDASVRILNIGPKFHQGIELEPGRYHVEVSTPGYKLEKEWIEVASGKDKHLNVHLVKITPDIADPKEKAFTNSIGMRFVYIEPGTFMMGSPPSEVGRDKDETQHQVTLTKGFYLAITEVTQGQWQKVMGNNPSYFKHCGDKCPVESVSWVDCQAFIQQLNQWEKTDKYRLPTEAEWEYACRAGSKTELYTGSMEVLGENNAPALDKIGWYGGNSCAEYEGAFDCTTWTERQYACPRCGTHPVAGKKPNAWGLHDMLGNVWEWCHDWHKESVSGPVTDPTGPFSGEFRVCRGGSWDTFAVGCRAATRDCDAPDYKDDLIGFRVAKTL
jgi:formylglycine-generating enzyme required for sulfatase activity